MMAEWAMRTSANYRRGWRRQPGLSNTNTEGEVVDAILGAKVM